MTSPVRLRLSRAKGFDLQKHSARTNGLAAVNVARPSNWGNPFVVGEDGDRMECVGLYSLILSGYLAVSKATMTAQQVAHDHATKHISELRGRNLACWCALDGKPCHADVLLALANKEQ